MVGVVLFWALVVYLPLLIVWGYVLVDLVRRSDIGLLTKLLWAVVALVVPWLGAAIYVTRRPVGAARRNWS